MKVAIVGSSGYIAGYLIRAFSDMPGVEQILKIDVKDADAILDLQHADQFIGCCFWGYSREDI